MNLLLDTCAALYLWDGDDRLSGHVADLLRSPENRLLFHQVSFLEIVLKHSKGNLALPDSPSVLVPKALDAYGMEFAPLGNTEIAMLETLPRNHGDPFDRLLISYAIANQLVVVTPDRMFRNYEVTVIW